MSNCDEVASCPCGTVYAKLYAQMGGVLQESLAGDFGALLNRSYTRFEDFELWIEALSGRPETTLLVSAFREYQFGLAALTVGLYRYAFSALRSFVEGSLGAVYLSAREVHLRLWLSGKRDLQWATIMDEDTGVYSCEFVQAFCEDMGEEVKHCRTMAMKLYRETSEYVHGNPGVSGVLPSTVAFVPDAQRTWHDKAEPAIYVVQFALFMRYSETLADKYIVKLEPALSGNLGHLSAVRRRLNRERMGEDG